MASSSTNTAVSSAPQETTSMLSLDAIVNHSQDGLAPRQTNEVTSNDARSVVGSITSERRKPRKLGIRSVPKQEPDVLSTSGRTEEVPLKEEIVATPEVETPIRRKPRKLVRDPATPGKERAESSGGVAIIAEQTDIVGDLTPASNPTDADHQGLNESATQIPDSEQVPATARKRPRKLNRNKSANAVAGPQPAPVSSNETTVKVPFKSEIEALKERVRDLEGQVRDLYERPRVLTARSPRRRGKGRKGSAEIMTPTEELTQLQAELVDAQNELAALKIQEGAQLPTALETPRRVPTSSNTPQSSRVAAPTPRSTPLAKARRTQESDHMTDDDVEDIPRSTTPGVEPVPPSSADPQKAVSLSGSYKIRLPNNLNMNDVRAIQDGVTSASNIARTIAANRASTSRTPDGDRDGKSWSEWFGSYSQSIARIMHNVETEAALESAPTAPRSAQQNGNSAKRTVPRATGTVRTQPASPLASRGALTSKRSPVQARSPSFSGNSQLVDGLMR